MGIASDHIDRLAQLSVARSSFERAWSAAKTVAAPDASDFALGLSGLNASNSALAQKPEAATGSVKMYDTTAVWCVDRLAAGIESLVAPQSEYWHGYDVEDLTVETLADSTKAWLERLRNLTFKARYKVEASFIPAVQLAIRRTIVFGNAFIEVEDGEGSGAMFRYSYVPLRESYGAVNKYNILDTFYRVYSLSARVARQKFGDRLSPELRRASESPTDADRQYTFVQCLHPRSDYGRLGIGSVQDAPIASVHIEYESQQVVKTSGYYEFPIIDFRWMPEGNSMWAEGPIMRALADIQSLNELAKAELVSAQQAYDPPLLIANAGVMNRPRTNPGALNLGGMNAQGQRLIEPMLTGQRLDFAEKILEAKRNQVKESMYINLFAILIRNPEMSATEAMIRANEKGELLGPAGSWFQLGLARMNKRELGIMKRAGVFDQSSIYRPPRELTNRTIMPSFSSPLDRYRSGKEVEGTAQLLNMVSPVAQTDPTVVDNLNGNEMIRGLANRLGVPVRFINDAKAVDAIRQQRQQAAALQQQAAIAKDFAAAGKSGVDAFAQAKQSGVF